MAELQVTRRPRRFPPENQENVVALLAKVV